MAQDYSTLAIDVGSSCVKLGWFPAAGNCAAKPATGDLTIGTPPLAFPDDVLRLEHKYQNARVWLAALDKWLDELPPTEGIQCVMGIVHQEAASALSARLEARPWARIKRLVRNDLGIEVRTHQPDGVGIDRLLGAVAANRLRAAGVPAIVVDMGTAVTVNLISADGAFEGGAILAGPVTSLTALHASTKTLPQLGAKILAEPPTVVGKSTISAMAAGAYWGAIGAIRELVANMAAGQTTSPMVFLSGGASAAFASSLCGGDPLVRHVPHLVLAGIRLAADRLPAP